jgi:sodium pump decarboxylase gamma subunit
MLANLLVEPTYISYGDAALYALIGFIVVFSGILFLIAVIWAVGKIMAKGNVQPVKEKPVKPVEVVSQSLAVADSTNDVSEETVAVITAALMAHYQTTNPKCEFTLKRIKRI